MGGQEEFLNPISHPAPPVGIGGETGAFHLQLSDFAVNLIHLDLVLFSGFVTLLKNLRGA
jgi:hypothetical protein